MVIGYTTVSGNQNNFLKIFTLYIKNSKLVIKMRIDKGTMPTHALLYA